MKFIDCRSIFVLRVVEEYFFSDGLVIIKLKVTMSPVFTSWFLSKSPFLASAILDVRLSSLGLGLSKFFILSIMEAFAVGVLTRTNRIRRIGASSVFSFFIFISTFDWTDVLSMIILTSNIAHYVKYFSISQ
jgi:hypothetical protein